MFRYMFNEFRFSQETWFIIALCSMSWGMGLCFWGLLLMGTPGNTTPLLSWCLVGVGAISLCLTYYCWKRTGNSNLV